jgi:hypothetical protein
MTITEPHQTAFSVAPSSSLLHGPISKAVLATVIAAGLLLGAAATNRGSSSLTRLADRVERADVLPETTRQELRQAIAALGTKVGLDDRSAEAVARIERAMQAKPAERPR